jgi:hypothetical protein
MDQTEPYRITRPVRLPRLGLFCHSLQAAVAAAQDSTDHERFWRLYVSADCPRCRIQISGIELRALALPPCAELATAKIGRMRLGNCARDGCDAWEYSVHFWNQSEFDWPGLLAAAENLLADSATPTNKRSHPWQTGLITVVRIHGLRVAALLGLLVVLWFARALYFGGNIPFLRVPETFAADPTPPDPTWPAPMDGSEGPLHR